MISIDFNCFNRASFCCCFVLVVCLFGCLSIYSIDLFLIYFIYLLLLILILILRLILRLIYNIFYRYIYIYISILLNFLIFLILFLSFFLSFFPFLFLSFLFLIGLNLPISLCLCPSLMPHLPCLIPLVFTSLPFPLSATWPNSTQTCNSTGEKQPTYGISLVGTAEERAQIGGVAGGVMIGPAALAAAQAHTRLSGSSCARKWGR